MTSWDKMNPAADLSHSCLKIATDLNRKPFLFQSSASYSCAFTPLQLFVKNNCSVSLLYLIIYHATLLPAAEFWWLQIRLSVKICYRLSSSVPPIMPVPTLHSAPFLPECQTHVISPPAVPSALERHKRHRWQSQQQPLWLTSTSPILCTARRISVSTSFAPRTLNYP